MIIISTRFPTLLSKNWDVRFGVRVAVRTFFKAETAVVFDCQDQRSSLAGVANKHSNSHYCHNLPDIKLFWFLIICYVMKLENFSLRLKKMSDYFDNRPVKLFLERASSYFLELRFLTGLEGLTGFVDLATSFPGLDSSKILTSPYPSGLCLMRLFILYR